MCLLVFVKANTRFPFSWFQDVHNSNPDGTGIMFVKDGQLASKKELTPTAEEAYEFWLHNAPDGVDYAMHFRMKTHGAIDVERVHPYPVNDDMLLMHNGILSHRVCGSDPDPKKSDTQTFAEQMGADLGDAVYNQAVGRLLGEVIGASNRFIYAHATHGLTIINEDTGVTTDLFPGCWFSNTYAWTPQRWGVKMSWGRTTYTSGSGIDWKKAYEEIDEGDGWYDAHGFSGAKKVEVGKDVTDLSDAILTDEKFAEMVDDLDEVGDTCEDIVGLAKDWMKSDASAGRFLQVYSTGAELYEHVRLLYPDPDDALRDLLPMQQYLEASQATFDDILDWLSIEGPSSDNNETMGEAHPNATYAG